ncbi:MAG: hypothetical protein KDD69_13595, partial [Bdellovibrionales bacterium]|nr:hypothetical protein [Bdellovibrionales bacterium]
MAERDFKDLLRSVRCWDADVERFYQENKQPIVDCALQNKDELTALCEWIEQEQIKSYLEVGCWTGRMVNALQELFRFTPCAACDLGIAR